jgi:DeoR/GlpR family transcriptional regulator of sugar metabolism
MTIECLNKFNIQTCFVGTAGFSTNGIFSSDNMIEAQLKTEALMHSERGVVITDSSKYNVSAFTIFAKSNDVDVLITDNKFKDKDKLLSHDIEVLIANVNENDLP